MAVGPVALDYLSPLPPVRSGIADYSADLLPHLAERCDVRVLRLEGQPVAEAIEERWHPQPVSVLGEGGRLPLYQMGNNPWHDGVREAALRVPGVLTLHDVLLHHQLIERTVGKRNWPAYRAELAADHGWIGTAVADGFRWGVYGQAGQFSLHGNRDLLLRQRGVLVHSEWAAGVLAEEMPGLLVRAIPMAIPLPREASRRDALALRERLGVPAESALLGSFGFQTPIKRTEVAIAALARPELRSCHLVVVGQAAAGLDLEEMAQEGGVEKRVHVLGFVPFADMERAIAACDLCLNLRYPTAGETSASLLRVLAAGRAVAVSDFAQFRELPSAIALKVPLGDGETEALVSAITEVLSTPGRLAEMGRLAREFVRRENDPERAASAVVEACAAMREAPPPARETDAVVAPPPTSWTWRKIAGRLDVEGAQSPWPEGERRRLTIRLRNHGPARWLAARHALGGTAIVCQLFDEGGADLLARDPWLALERDLEPGEGTSFQITVRRPVGRARLRIEPRILGRQPMWQLGGPAWESDL
jgi:glycosyltransferase involved in cell wall biosynthesis